MSIEQEQYEERPQGPTIYTFGNRTEWGSIIKARLGYELPRPAGYAVTFDKIAPQVLKYQIQGIALSHGQRLVNPSTDIEGYNLVVRPCDNLNFPERGIPLVQATIYRNTEDGRMTVLNGDLTCRIRLGSIPSNDYRITYETVGEDIAVANITAVEEIHRYGARPLNASEVDRLNLDKLGFPESIDVYRTLAMYRRGLIPNREGVVTGNYEPLTAEGIYRQPLLPYIALEPSQEGM